jgi:hypothetical protein
MIPGPHRPSLHCARAAASAIADVTMPEADRDVHSRSRPEAPVCTTAHTGCRCGSVSTPNAANERQHPVRHRGVCTIAEGATTRRDWSRPLEVALPGRIVQAGGRARRRRVRHHRSCPNCAVPLPAPARDASLLWSTTERAAGRDPAAPLGPTQVGTLTTWRVRGSPNATYDMGRWVGSDRRAEDRAHWAGPRSLRRCAIRWTA